jgi:hypothetical protein
MGRIISANCNISGWDQLIRSEQANAFVSAQSWHPGEIRWEWHLEWKTCASYDWNVWPSREPKDASGDTRT